MQTAQFIIELLKAVFLGIVEGITEWLPISSTGHLILVNEFLNLRQSKDFIDMFNIVIQLGAILAVMVIYFKRLNPFQPGKTAREVQLTWQLWLKVVIACIPSAFFGLLLDDWMEAHLSNFFVVAIMLVVYGIAFIWIEDRNRRVEPKVTDLARMSYKTVFYIGLFQYILSLFDGTHLCKCRRIAHSKLHILIVYLLFNAPIIFKHKGIIGVSHNQNVINASHH